MAEPVKRYWRRRWQADVWATEGSTARNGMIRLEDSQSAGHLRLTVRPMKDTSEVYVVLDSRDVAELAALLTKLAEELGARATLEALG